MGSKCQNCGFYVDDSEETCKKCGTINPYYRKSFADDSATIAGIPTTIQELKAWYVDNKLPDESITRFFIGVDYKDSKAFGIYKDDLSGNFVVYKNNADGTRIIRYKGLDEKYAVNEVYMKLKEEILDQRQKDYSEAPQSNLSKGFNNSNKKSNKLKQFILIVIFIVIVVFIVDSISNLSPSEGYYEYNDSYYYYQSGVWYKYDDVSGWYKTSVDDELEDNYNDYYVSSFYSSSYNTEDFSDTDYYVESSSSSSDSDGTSSSS